MNPDLRSAGPATSRRQSQAVYRRRRLVVFGGGGIVLAAVVFLLTVFGVPLPSALTTVTAPDSLSGEPASVVIPPFGPTRVTADGYGVIVSSGDDAVGPIASINKTITALMVLRAHPLTGDETGPTITFGQSDVDIIADIVAVNGNYADVAVGDSTTERNALTVMMLKSANNIAESLAVWAYGSREEYVTATNAWLREQGLTHTVVADASGLDSATVSTPSDLLVIGQLALANPVLASIVDTAEVDLPLFGALTNGNTLLGTSGINGIKTGTTDDAGACLLYSATFSVGEQAITLIGDTMGAPHQPELQEAVSELVASVEQGFHQIVLADPASGVATATTEWGTTSDIVPASALAHVTWSDTPIRVAVSLHDIRGGKQGDVVGRITFSLDGKDTAVDLVLARDLGDPGPGWRLTHVSQLFG